MRGSTKLTTTNIERRLETSRKDVRRLRAAAAESVAALTFESSVQDGV
jgi:hypothetical protein